MQVEVNGRLLMICISTSLNLAVVERSTAETLKGCQLRLSGDTGFGHFPLTAPLFLH